MDGISRRDAKARYRLGERSQTRAELDGLLRTVSDRDLRRAAWKAEA